MAAAADRRRTLLAAWVVLTGLVSLDAAAFSRSEWERAGWRTDFEAGLAAAGAGGRPAFVTFEAAWCSWCQQYSRDTLAAPAVREVLQRDFVRVAVDADTRPDLMRRYGGKGLPFTLVLAPDGTVRSHFVGVMQPADLISMLEESRRPAIVVQPIAAGEVRYRVDTPDRRGYEAFRAAWLQHLEALYEPARATLSGQFDSGTTQKRTPVLAWLWLMDHGLWPDRAAAAGRVARQSLWDPVGTGFFNFIDPSRDDYLESSKLLESNAWMTAWQAQLGAHDPAAARTAQLAARYLREVLGDREQGGFFQAQVADNAYYALQPAERLRRPAPLLDRVKRADTHAQAAWALLRVGRHAGDDRMVDDAVRALDFVLGVLWHEGRLYHAWRDGMRTQPDLPHSVLWVLAAGEAVEQVRPDASRRAALDAIARRAGHWLDDQMRLRHSPELDNELSGLIAWCATRPALASHLPKGAREWALRQLRIEAETAPDELVVGLWAWEAALARR